MIIEVSRQITMNVICDRNCLFDKFLWLAVKRSLTYLIFFDSASTSSSDSESIPRTPVFEEFEKANARRARSSSSASSMPLQSKGGL